MDSNTKAGLSSIADELQSNPPAIVNATKRKFGAKAAGKQRVAILLSKGRKAGLSIPAAPGRTSK